MDAVLLGKLEGLKEAMEGDPRFIALEELNQEILHDEEVISYSRKVEAIAASYSLLLSYKKKDDPEVKEVEKSLHEAKLALDLLPLCQKYNEAYKTVNELLLEINDVLFGPFQRKTVIVEGRC